MTEYKISSFFESLKQRELTTIIFGVDIFCAYLSWLISNYTKITPNQVTLVSFISVILTSYYLINGNLIFVAVFFWLAFLFDCVDGSVARVKNQFSKYGDFLDKINDTFKPMIISIGLLYYGNNNSLGYIFILLVLFWVSLNYISSSVWLIFESKSKITGNQKITEYVSTKNSLVAKWYIKSKELKIKPIITTGDLNMFLFIILLPFFSNVILIFKLINLLIFLYILIEIFVILKNI
jgi:phosphatidylglycerophosphate synthase